MSRLGAGRERKGDPVDHAVGLVFRVRIGDQVRRGEALATVHARTPEDLARVAVELPKCIRLGEDAVEPPPLIHARVG